MFKILGNLLVPFHKRRVAAARSNLRTASANMDTVRRNRELARDVRAMRKAGTLR
jgi:lauroyl/myristoyl acyltransferase